MQRTSYYHFSKPMATRINVVGAAVVTANTALSNVYDNWHQNINIEPPVIEDYYKGEHSPELYDAYWYHPDHLGSSSYITNLSGRVTQHMEYLPFGETLVDEHLNSHNSPFKFNAKELDAETGNYYYGARYYNPRWSIWLSIDPLAEKYPDWSPYNYTLQNPIKYVDPDGEDVIWSEFLRKALGNNFISKLENTKTFKSIFRRFINNQDNHFFEAKTLSDGRLGHGASALIQRGGDTNANGFVTNIQKAYFVKGKLIADETFIVAVILHEGIHQRKNIRINQDGISNYDGYDDFYNNPYHKSRQSSGDLHHNQMATFDRLEIISGMKEFDKENGTTHSEDWYSAMSWFGLQRTEAWKDFEAKNPTKAKRYNNLIEQEIKKMETNKNRTENGK